MLSRSSISCTFTTAQTLLVFFSSQDIECHMSANVPFFAVIFCDQRVTVFCGVLFCLVEMLCESHTYLQGNQLHQSLIYERCSLKTGLMQH